MSGENPLNRIPTVGQSIWYDNIQRGLIHSGEMKRMIDEDDIRGVTSNPTIFDKAISGGTEYDADITRLLEKGLSVEELYWELVIKDIQDAADVFLPVYEKTSGVDGFISIEVSPHLANDTEGTVKQARELRQKVNRKNVMIKVPATEEGLPAIEALIADGIHVNVTLIFSIDRYEAVMDAYLSGLEKRAAAGNPVSGVQSVASFFVSRLDSVIDQQLSEKGDQAKALMGKAGIANSKIAYQSFLKVFGSERFKKLKQEGADVQRPLWASTSVKNPEYRDTLYAEQLMGPDTVNTLPPVTVDAFRDHGIVANEIEKNVGEAESELNQLADAGISLSDVTDELEVKGVRAFQESFDQLLKHLESKKEQLALKD